MAEWNRVFVRRVNPISQTAYYCCGVRMQDAESKKPLIGDHYARTLMGSEGLEYWEGFKKFKYANASNVARHYIIDTQLRERLSQQPDTTVVIVGAGLDSRAFRLNGGHWIEIDEHPLIEYKNTLLPPKDCPNKLERIAIDFGKEKLIAKLAPYSTLSPVIVVIEGVLMYLTDDQKEALLQTLTSIFRTHTLLCDLMGKRFFEKLGYRIHHKIMEGGATFTDLSDDPAATFLAKGYRQTSAISTIQTAAAKGVVPMPPFIAKLLFGKLLMGYAVHTFEYDR